MKEKENNQDFLNFVSRLTSFISDYTPQQLNTYLSLSDKGFPLLSPVIRSLLSIASPDDISENILSETSTSNKIKEEKSDDLISQPIDNEIFDLLCSKKIFPQNKDLIEFAINIFPHMPNKRYDKMSRKDISLEITRFIQMQNKQKRLKLEKALKETARKNNIGDKDKTASFLDKWEKIIQEMKL